MTGLYFMPQFASNESNIKQAGAKLCQGQSILSNLIPNFEVGAYAYYARLQLLREASETQKCHKKWKK